MKFREPINTWTHLIGAVLSAVAMGVMIQNARIQNSTEMIIGAIVFGVSMILLYSASAIYHGYNGKESIILTLRKLDHSMIFVLIAGTYTPICLTLLRGKLGTGLLISIWALAIVGIILKVFFINMPRWVGSALYLILGWISVFFAYPLLKVIPIDGFLWLLLGGLFYTVGSIIYARKSEKMKIGNFGFHEIFHIFIMLGTFSHFYMVNHYIFKG